MHDPTMIARSMKSAISKARLNDRECLRVNWRVPKSEWCKLDSARSDTDTHCQTSQTPAPETAMISPQQIAMNHVHRRFERRTVMLEREISFLNGVVHVCHRPAPKCSRQR